MCWLLRSMFECCRHSNLPCDDFNYYMDLFRTTPHYYSGNYYFISPNSFQIRAQLLYFPFQIKTSVIWATPNVTFSIPLWVIILAILLGLLVLAILTLALWKVSLFLLFFLLSREATEGIYKDIPRDLKRQCQRTDLEIFNSTKGVTGKLYHVCFGKLTMPVLADI